MSTRSGPWQTIAEERRRRVLSRKAEGAEALEVFETALATMAASETVLLQSAYDFASAVDYHHPGLSPASYLAHPVRVMAAALHLTVPSDTAAGVLSLLHNIYEVSDVGRVAVAARFGAPIADAISALTVNRLDQSRAYLESYYRALSAAPPFVRVVKVLDKVDNLFQLGLNQDANVRATYLADVETFVVPLARTTGPAADALVPYLKDLVTECRQTGAFTLEDFV